MLDATATKPLPPLAPQPLTTDSQSLAIPMVTTVPVVVPQQLQREPTPPRMQTAPPPRTLLPIQPRLQLTTAHLSAAIAVISAQPATPSPRPPSNDVPVSTKPRKITARPPLELPAPLLAAASAALGSMSDDATVSPPLSTTSTSSTSRTATGNRLVRKMKKCSVSFCESYARSRGLCKAHGGGKRCMRPGCEVSDQGGGFCIRHGGGKRCLFEGCEKSAQSRHYCKAHGGGARCLMEGCNKSSQGGGLCRAHGGGPRRKRTVNNRGELIDSPRTRKRTKYRAQVAARALVGAARVIAEQESLSEPLLALGDETIECAPGSTSLSFKIRRPDTKTSSRGGKSKNETRKTAFTKRDNDTSEEHDTHMFVVASLLGMQTASAE